MKIVQVNNLIAVGGTTTCAMAVCDALPAEHTIISLGSVDGKVKRWLEDCFGITILVRNAVTPGDCADATAVILNNTAADQVPEELPAPVLYWHHSRYQGQATGDHVAWASDWLREKAAGQTLHQGALAVDHEARAPEFTVGRLATPGGHKRHEDDEQWWSRLDVPGKVYVGHVQIPGVTCIPPEIGLWSRMTEWHAMVVRSPVTESFGRCVIEAMMAGCVPVVDGRGGHCETVIDGETGFLCKRGEHEKKIHWLRDHPDEWASMSEKAKLHAKEKFGPHPFAKRLFRALRLTLEQWVLHRG